MTRIDKTSPPWEHGSEFHWSTPSGSERGWLPADSRYLGSGRDALRFLLHHGRSKLGWKRFWMPSYLCQEVVRSAIASGLDCRVYKDAPVDYGAQVPREELGHGDVLLWVNYFGMRGGCEYANKLQRRGVVFVEDHSHDLLSNSARATGADFAIASLRKTLPVPDGGLLWSPLGHMIPEGPGVTDERETAAHRRLAAMLLKGMYLDGLKVSKPVFRSLATQGESQIASGSISGMSTVTREILPAFPAARWREQRTRNHRAAREVLAQQPWVDVPVPEDAVCAPFALVVVLDSAVRREHVRTQLISRSIYPAVLWPLEEPVLPGIPLEQVELSRRILSIHCDYRYDEETMRRVAKTIVEIGTVL